MKSSASGLARVGVPLMIAPPPISTPASLRSPQLANNMDHGIAANTNRLQECVIVILLIPLTGRLAIDGGQ
jgi:hypothetical protein